MRRPIRLILIVAALAAWNVMASRGAMAADVLQINLTEWTPPNISTVGDGRNRLAFQSPCNF